MRLSPRHGLREGRAALLIGVAVHMLFISSLFGQFLNPLFAEARHAHGQAADSFGIYAAGEDLVHGRSIYGHRPGDEGITRRVPYFYFFRYLPPTAYVSALATLVLSPWASYVAWVIVTEILLMWIVWSILKLKRHPIGERRAHAAVWLGFFPFYLEQWMGQYSFLMAAFLWVMMRPGSGFGQAAEEPRRGTDAVSPLGLRAPAFWAWTASVALKSFTALFALSFLRRKMIRPVLWCAGIVLVLCAPYWIARPEDVKPFLALNLRPFPPAVYDGTLGASAFVRLIGWSLPAEVAGRRLVFGSRDIYAGNLPIFAVNALIVAVTLWIVLRRGRRMPLDLQMSLWLLAFFLTFKDIWEYHYVMLLPVVSALGLAYRSRLALWMGVLLALPTPFALLARPDGSLGMGANVIHHACKALPTLALFVWVVRRSRDSGG